MSGKAASSGIPTCISKPWNASAVLWTDAPAGTGAAAFLRPLPAPMGTWNSSRGSHGAVKRESPSASGGPRRTGQPQNGAPVIPLARPHGLAHKENRRQYRISRMGFPVIGIIANPTKQDAVRHVITLRDAFAAAGAEVMLEN